MGYRVGLDGRVGWSGWMIGLDGRVGSLAKFKFSFNFANISYAKGRFYADLGCFKVCETHSIGKILGKICFRQRFRCFRCNFIYAVHILPLAPTFSPFFIGKEALNRSLLSFCWIFSLFNLILPTLWFYTNSFLKRKSSSKP